MIYLIFFMAIVTLLGYVKHRTIFNFITVFFGIWLLVIVLYSLQLSYHLEKLSETTIKNLFLTFSAFLIGYLLMYFYKFKTDPKTSIEFSYLYKNFNVNEKFIDISFLIILIGTIGQGLYSGGYPLIWLLTGDERNYFNYGIPSFNGLLISFIIFYSSILFILIIQKRSKKHLLIFTIMILLPFLILSRQILITLFIQILFIHHLSIKRLNFYKLIPIGLFSILLFGILGNMRTGLSQFVKVAALKDENISFIFSGFYWVYMYLTMTLANINNLFTNIQFDLAYGWNMLNAFLPTVIVESFFSR